MKGSTKVANQITRRGFGKLLAGTTIASSVLAHETFLFPGFAAVDSSGKAIFPYGTHVYREPHLPLEQFRHDFPVLKRLGFTMIKIQEVWSYDEPREGHIDLSNVSQVVAEARQNGLRVYFGVTMENAPAWFWKKYPDATMVYEDGEPNNDPTPYDLPADGKPGPCWHHPQAVAHGQTFVEAVGKEIGKYDNIEVWNVFQEIGLSPSRTGHLGLCYCQNTLVAFRKWLQTKYGSLANLNSTWLTAYGDWDEIQPPRSSPKLPPTIDFRYFMDDVYLSFSVRWKADAFRKSDPLHRPILAHIGGVNSFGSSTTWRYAQEVDVLGSSCYPGWVTLDEWDALYPTSEKPMSNGTQANHEMSSNVMLFDYLRSTKADGKIWTAELQGGPITEGLNRRRVPSPADIRRWVLSCLAAGVRGVCFWNHRPEIFWEEGYGFSLLDWGSDTTERAEEAGRIAQGLNEHVELFTKGALEPPSVGIVVSEDNFHFAEGSLHDVAQHLNYTVRGNWKSLWKLGIPASFLDITSLPKDNTQFKALILPFPLALSQSSIEALTVYVGNGGTLISEACPGRFSNYGIGFEGAMAPGISELFGAKHEGVFLIREPGHGAKWTIHNLGPRDLREFKYLDGTGIFSPATVFPAFYLQTLLLTTGNPILTYDQEIAGSVRQHGQGKAYLIGTFLGHAGPAYDDWRNAEFLRVILTAAGVTPDRVGTMNRRRRVFGNQSAWFFFNSTEFVIEESVSMEEFTSAKDLLGDDLSQSGRNIQLKVDPISVRCIVLGR